MSDIRIVWHEMTELYQVKLFAVHTFHQSTVHFLALCTQPPLLSSRHWWSALLSALAAADHQLHLITGYWITGRLFDWLTVDMDMQQRSLIGSLQRRSPRQNISRLAGWLVKLHAVFFRRRNSTTGPCGSLRPVLTRSITVNTDLQCSVAHYATDQSTFTHQLR